MKTQTPQPPSDATACSVALTDSERRQIVEILERRSNDIASFKDDVRLEKKELPGSVELALTREIQRLRRLADKVRPSTPEQTDEE